MLFVSFSLFLCIEHKEKNLPLRVDLSISEAVVPLLSLAPFFSHLLLCSFSLFQSWPASYQWSDLV